MTQQEYAVNKAYLEILGRSADAGGLAHYASRLLAGEITEDDLRTVLKDSDEYKRKAAPVPSPVAKAPSIGFMETLRLHGALMTMNEGLDIVPNVTTLLRRVDTLTIVDGGSTDGTIQFLRNLARQDSRLRLFIHPWRDDFPAQRNHYMDHVGELARDGDWLVVHDPDEFIDEGIDLRELASFAASYHFAAVGFQCRSVSLRGHERVWENVDQHWKPILLKWNHQLRYSHHGEGPVHETFVGLGETYCPGRESGYPAAMIRPPAFYEHRKQEDMTWIRGVRNYFCGGGGMNLGSNNPRWVEMRAIAKRLGLDRWNLMYTYLLNGCIDPELRAWMIKYRQETGWDGASEQREWYKVYFRMFHPEEEPNELRGEQIP